MPSKSAGTLLARTSRRKTAPPSVSEPSVTEPNTLSEAPTRGVKGKTGLAIRPEKVEKKLRESGEEAPARSLESLLSEVLELATPTTSARQRAEQVRSLMALRYPKEPLLSLEVLPWIHEVAGMLSGLGFDTTYAFLSDMVANNIRPNDWVVGSPLFAKEQEAFRYRIRNLTLQIEVSQGIYACGKCGGKNTISMPLQLRGGDESMTDVVTCIACGHKFHR